MKKLKMYTYYYIGHVISITWNWFYTPGSYEVYQYCMRKASDLDTDGLIWKDHV